MTSEDPLFQEARETRNLTGKLIRYGIVGAISNGLLYLLYVGLTLLLSLAPLLASTIVFAIGIGVTYIGNALWAFDRPKSHGYSLPRYVLTYFSGFCVQIGVLSGLISVFGMPHLIAQLIGMGAAAVTIFLLLNLWVFRNPAST